MPLRVLLADDHALVRAGIRALLTEIPDVEVVGEAGSGADALRLAETTHPDIVLLDIAMPGLGGLEVARRLLADQPAVRVLILSMHNSEEYVIRAINAGCSGYLMKGSSSAELAAAIRAVAAGKTYLSSAIPKQSLIEYVERTGAVADPIDVLTPRQREILQLVAEGHTSKQIAQRLSLSFKTVEAHRAQIMQRLDVHDLAGLVRFAMRVGLVPPEDY
jgi:DNA-binding NarL/FixJ family response regulator